MPVHLAPSLSPPEQEHFDWNKFLSCKIPISAPTTKADRWFYIFMYISWLSWRGERTACSDEGKLVKYFFFPLLDCKLWHSWALWTAFWPCKSKYYFRAIFVWPWKKVSVSVRSLFHQPIDEKIKTWPLRFPAKETLIWRRRCSIGQSCCSML